MGAWLDALNLDVLDSVDEDEAIVRVASLVTVAPFWR
jgi:hypothetical protein